MAATDLMLFGECLSWIPLDRFRGFQIYVSFLKKKRYTNTTKDEIIRRKNFKQKCQQTFFFSELPLYLIELNFEENNSYFTM